VTLQEAQDAAEEAGLLFPLSLSSQGSCTIGGNLATNAGGTAVLRYGSMRDLTLGLEFVTADGQLHSSLTGLRKDNTYVCSLSVTSLSSLSFSRTRPCP
jgi:FAD/FMN-containing dehydrogenase